MGKTWIWILAWVACPSAALAHEAMGTAMCCDWKFGNRKAIEAAFVDFGQMPEELRKCSQITQSRAECSRHIGKTNWKEYVKSLTRIHADSSQWPAIDPAQLKIASIRVKPLLGKGGNPLGISLSFSFESKKRGTVSLVPYLWAELKDSSLGRFGRFRILAGEIHPSPAGGSHTQNTEQLLLGIRIQAAHKYTVSLKLYPEFIQRPDPDGPLCVSLSGWPGSADAFQKKIQADTGSVYFLRMDRPPVASNHKLLPLSKIYSGHRKAGTPECAKPKP